MSTAWTSRYAQRTKNVRSSTIRELLKITQNPEIISFAGGLPHPMFSRSNASAKLAARCSITSLNSRFNMELVKATSRCAK